MNLNFLLNNQLDTSKYPQLYGLRDNKSLISRLGLDRKLESHNGCVNTINWSDTNCNLILSGSDDQNLCITDAFSGITSLRSGHRANIFCAKFLPKSNDEKIISCAADGSIYLSDINYSAYENNQNHFNCHGEKTCYELRTFSQDPFIFMSCGQDGCCKWIDLRQNSKCDKPSCQEHTLIKLSGAIGAIAINPYVPYHIVCAGLDGIVRFYDRRMLSVGSFDSSQTISSLTAQSTNGLFACFGVPNESGSFSTYKRITSVQYDNWGNQVLASYQSDKIYLLDWRDLSLENQNDMKEVNNCTSSSSEEQNKSNETNDQQSSANPNLSSPRKFRIQSDWSDTGPNSMPVNDTPSGDPRAFLMRRLNDWFRDLYQNRPSNRATATGTTSPTSSTSSPNTDNNNSVINTTETNQESTTRQATTSTSHREKPKTSEHSFGPTTSSSTSTDRKKPVNNSNKKNQIEKEEDDDDDDNDVDDNENNDGDEDDDEEEEEDDEDDEEDEDDRGKKFNKKSNSRIKRTEKISNEKKNKKTSNYNSSSKQNESNEENSNDEEETGGSGSASQSSRLQDAKNKSNNLSPTASYLIGSRIRSKQAKKIENGIIKSKPSPKVKMIYTGHRNVRTVIKECNFWGNDYIISGSDCGHIFIWNKHSGKIVNVIEADKHVVNCVQENPLYPVLASSGIDYNIKIWQPTFESPVDIDSKIDMIIKRNRIMLDEIRNTIFIPVQFMVPALRLFGANMRGNPSRTSTSTSTNNNTNRGSSGNNNTDTNNDNVENNQ